MKHKTNTKSIKAKEKNKVKYFNFNIIPLLPDRNNSKTIFKIFIAA